MTTIAYKDGHMASDKLAWLGRGETVHGRKSKIRRLEDGSLCGISTSVVGASEALFAWIAAGMQPEVTPKPEPNEFSILIVSQAGEITYFSDGFWPQHFEAEFIAIGSGSSYAMGAMAAGTTAAGAVAIAQRFDAFSEGGVDCFKLKDDEHGNAD